MQAEVKASRDVMKDIMAVEWLPLPAAIRRLSYPLEKLFLRSVGRTAVRRRQAPPATQASRRQRKPRQRAPLKRADINRDRAALRHREDARTRYPGIRRRASARDHPAARVGTAFPIGTRMSRGSLAKI